MGSGWVIVIIALAGFAPAIGSLWWLLGSRHREQRQAEVKSRMLAAYPPGPPPMPEPGPPLIVVRPRRPRPAAFQPPVRAPVRTSGRHARLD